MPVFELLQYNRVVQVVSIRTLRGTNGLPRGCLVSQRQILSKCFHNDRHLMHIIYRRFFKCLPSRYSWTESPVTCSIPSLNMPIAARNIILLMNLAIATFFIFVSIPTTWKSLFVFIEQNLIPNWILKVLGPCEQIWVREIHF